eukprot:3020945-Prorocentrum_lima.AAC.1
MRCGMTGLTGLCSPQPPQELDHEPHRTQTTAGSPVSHLNSLITCPNGFAGSSCNRPPRAGHA